MADNKHAEEESEEEEGELRECKKSKSVEESEEEDLVLQYGEDSNNSTDSKKRKRSSDDEDFPDPEPVDEKDFQLSKDDFEIKVETKRFKSSPVAAEDSEEKKEEPEERIEEREQRTEKIEERIEESEKKENEQIVDKVQSESSSQMETVVRVQNEPSYQLEPKVNVQSEPSYLLETAVKVQSEPSSQMETVVKIQSEPSYQLEPTLKVQSEPSSQMETVVKVQSEPSYLLEPEVKLQSEPSYLLEPAVKVQSELSFQMETLVKVQSEPSYLLEPALKVQSEPSFQRETIVKVQSEPSYKLEPAVKMQSEPSYQMKTVVKTQSIPRYQMETVVKTQSEPRHQMETVVKARNEPSYQMETVVIKKEIESDAEIDFEEEEEPIEEKRIKKTVFTDEALLKTQDIFGIHFDYEIFGKYGVEEYEVEEIVCKLEDDESTEKLGMSNKQPQKKTMKVFEVYEPTLLRHGHSTDMEKICATDIPERMQLRLVPITPVAEGSDELDLEAKWIYEQAFCKRTISIQDAHFSEKERERLIEKIKNGFQTTEKIKKALDLIRNQHFEVPFISFYRKEHVMPELDINDLWIVYKYDAKWCQIRQRKEHLLRLFENMKKYQLDVTKKCADGTLPKGVRFIKSDDIERLKNAKTSEEVHDLYRYFKLHYSQEVEAMKKFIRCETRKEDKIEKRRKLVKEAQEKGENPPPPEDTDDEEDQTSNESVEQPERNDPYSICRRAGLDSFTKTFGLTSDEFAENLRENYQRHEVKQEPFEPMITASQFCGKKFSAPEKILKSAQFMYAIQIACEPLVRQTVRSLYMEKAKLTVRATKKGVKEIDENHPIFTMKYLKNKPVKDLVGDQFLKLVIAEQEELITITFGDSIEGSTTSNYISEVKQFIYKHEFSMTVKAWNTLRVVSVEMALIKMVIPDIKKELRANLLLESKDCVMRACCRKVHDWIKIAPYTCQFPREEEEEWNTSNGIRVMGIAYVPDESQPSWACIVEPNGTCSAVLKLLNLLKRRNSLREGDKFMKEADLLAIRNLIASCKPHVVAVGGESRDALMIQLEIREIIAGLIVEERFPSIQVEICDNDLAKIYAKSKKGVSEFREHCPELRQAISICRRLQDPLIEFSQLCTSKDEILSLRYHPLQDQLPEDELLENIYTEFINRVNQVGVNVNKAAQRSYSGNLLRFVCGLGPRKAQALIKVLKKQVDQKLENRAQLVTICNLGPKVFINCAGFIKIDTCTLKDTGDAYVEVLDGSRIHPENYEWARKMAVDALEYEEDECENSAKALEEIFSAPQKLKDLDLDTFAENLKKQGFGDKRITLYDIRAELSCMYMDLREVYRSPNSEKLFYILTKETPDSFHAGKLVVAKVVGISHRKPQGDQLDNVKPARNDETGHWQCPFCFKNDFLELSEVWIHVEAICPGKAMGVKLRLDNGVSGYIHIKNLSDKHVVNPRERVCINQPIHCRITKIDVEKFGVECTSRSKDLADKDNEWRPPKDAFYDKDGEEREKRQDEEVKKVTMRQAYLKQIIGHPSFRNIDFAEAERLMRDKQQGTVIVRPSSKGPNHLTVTWKLAEDVIQHIDVIEEGKASDFALGAKLRIGNEEFEDLDKIVAKHINPMAAFVTEILNFKYFKPSVGGVKEKAEEILKAQKRENPSSIPYLISASRTYPGNFLLSHLPRNVCRHEYFSVIPEGFKFRTQVFVRLNDLIRWFKEHFKEPIPPQAASTAVKGTTRIPHQSISTSGDTPHESIKKSQNIHDRSKISFQSQVPVSGYNGHNTYANNPYSPSGQTSNQTTNPSESPQAAFLHPASLQGQSNQGAEVNKPQQTENGVNNSSLTWNQQIEAKVFDDTYFTKTRKPKKVYDNGVGYGLTFPTYSKKKKFGKGKNDGDKSNDSWYDEPSSSKDSFDDHHFSFGSSRDPRGASRDPFDDNPYARGTSRDRTRRDSFEKFSNHGSSPKRNGDYNPFTVGSCRDKPSHDYPSSPPRNSFRGSFRGRGKERESSYRSSPPRAIRHSRSPSRGRSPMFNPKSSYRERSPAYSHHSRERSVGYSSRHSRERSPRFSSRSSWERSPSHRSSPHRGRSPSFSSRRSRDGSPRYDSHSRDRSPGNRYNSRSSWDRSPVYRSNLSRERSVGFKPRSSRDLSPRFNPSPPRERSPRFSKPYRSSSPRFAPSPPRHRSPQFNPHFPQDDDPEEDNPFIVGSSRDKSRDGGHENGNTSRESSPSFNKGPFNFRGRGTLKFRGRGRGSRYDVVSPRDIKPGMMPGMPGFNGNQSFPPVPSNNSSRQEIELLDDDNPFLVGSCRDPSLKKD